MAHRSVPTVTRRRFGITAGYALASAAFGGACAASTKTAAASGARFTARPRADAKNTLTSGALGLGRGDRDGLIQLPSSPPGPPDGPLPLLIFLHGATQNAAGMMRRVGPAADRAGIAVLAPDSRGTTWDAIRDGFGDDVAFLDHALEQVFARLRVDPARVAVGGFSDGASYALSLGLANGDLFPRVVAFSPGFVIPVEPQGRPRCFVSHGTADRILPIDQCSRVIVPRLRRLGHDVTFREFEGRHEMPADVVAEGLRWMSTAP